MGSIVAAPGLWSTGPVVVVHRLSCSLAHGIFLDQGSNPYPLSWLADSLPLSHQESPNKMTFWKNILRNKSFLLWKILGNTQGWGVFLASYGALYSSPDTELLIKVLPYSSYLTSPLSMSPWTQTTHPELHEGHITPVSKACESLKMMVECWAVIYRLKSATPFFTSLTLSARQSMAQYALSTLGALPSWGEGGSILKKPAFQAPSCLPVWRENTQWGSCPQLFKYLLSRTLPFQTCSEKRICYVGER